MMVNTMRATEMRVSTPTTPPMIPPMLPLGMAPLATVAPATAPLVPPTVAPVVPPTVAPDVLSVVVPPVEICSYDSSNNKTLLMLVWRILFINYVSLHTECFQNIVD